MESLAKSRSLSKRLARQRLVTEGWRDLLGMVMIASIVCCAALAALAGWSSPLVWRAGCAAAVAVAGIAVPTVREFVRWIRLRDRVRRERRVERRRVEERRRPAA